MTRQAIQPKVFLWRRIVHRSIAGALLCCTVTLGSLAQEVSPNRSPGDGQLGPAAVPLETRTVLELVIQQVGSAVTDNTPVVIIAKDGPPRPTYRQVLERDDLPFPVSFSVGILDRDIHVVEIHFFAEADDGEADRLPIQKVLLDDRAEVQVELEHDLTLILRWVDLRDEVATEIDGELVYRPAAS